MSAPNYKTVKKQIDGMKSGQRFFVNSINLSINGIELIREYIKKGIITPDIEEVKKAYKDIDAVMSGNVIFPQMDYIKN